MNQKTLANLGEFGLIARIRERIAANIPPEITGIGDDCAVVPISETKSLLISTDALIENTHFILDKIPASALGYKTVAVNLSDIAAMGGEAKYLVLAVGLPPNTQSNWFDEFMAGIKQVLEKYQVLLIGGDTTRSDSGWVISATVIGEAHPSKIKYRSSAQVGDLICVTGNLGDSAAGLYCSQHNLSKQQLLAHHFYPTPQLVEGQLLAAYSEVHAMLDISDGLDSDLTRLSESSNCGVEIALDKLPISPSLAAFALEQGLDPYEIAAAGGEDYCLLLTIDHAAYPKIAQQFQRPLTVIGKVTKNIGRSYSRNKKPYQLRQHGFEHFKS